MKVIILKGGPLDGVAHEVEYGFPIPDRLGLPDDEGTARHWYATWTDRKHAGYIGSEPIDKPKPGGVNRG
jgi:hypothetical protein